MIFLIESPNDREVFYQSCSGIQFMQLFRLLGVPAQMRQAISAPAFGQAIRDFTESKYAILHLLTHGLEDGIQLTDGTLCKWPTLAQLLEPANKAQAAGIMINLSCCHGYNGLRMACTHLKPFYSLIGPLKEVSEREQLLAYAVFYYQLFWYLNRDPSAVNVPKLVEEMNKVALIESGRSFTHVWGQEMQSRYIEYLQGQLETARAAGLLSQPPTGTRPPAGVPRELSPNPGTPPPAGCGPRGA